MQELFSGSNADGSLAMDQQTCCDVDNKSDSSDDEGLNDISSYARPIDIAAEDSDTLPSPTCADNGSSGTSRAGKKRPRGSKSPSSKSPSKKQQPKPKNRFTDATEKISNTMDHLVDQLGNPPPPPPVPQFCDPYASLGSKSPSKKQQPKPKSRFTDATEKISNTMDRLVDQLGNPPPPPPFCDPYASLWKRIDALPISTNDKVAVGNYLGRQENEGVRGFLASSADTTVETWVYQF
uniref:Uncharacterized protein n=1 Tax=Oryza rufipogon TaxID=4529 RepID=A0A0E0PGR9_ORYRU